MLHRTKLVVMLALSYVAINQGAAAFAPLLPTSSLLLTTTAATLLDTTTINEAGNYYLGTDLSGPLVINTPQVFLNLSGYTINGGLELTGAADVVYVYNGSIDGDGGVAVVISEGLKNILFSQLLLTNCSVGVQANGTLAAPIKRIALDQVEVEGAVSDGVDLTYCQELLIADSTFFNNGNYGLFLQNCSRGLIDGCSFVSSTSAGLFIDFANNIRLVQNNFTSNGSYGCFLTDNAQEVTFNGCSASNNTFSGFYNQGVDIDFYQCAANNNGGDGFTLDASSTNCLLQENSAKNNVGCGFNDLVAASVVYVSNLAHGNTDDYCVLSAPVLPALPPYYFASIILGAAGVSSWTNVQA